MADQTLTPVPDPAPDAASRLCRRLTLAGHVVLPPSALRVLAAVARFRRRHGIPPTLADLAAALRCNHNNLVPPVARLRRLGLLSMDGARSLVLRCRTEDR
jgi:Mn-dependent DtxR family transcriptional regulator